MELPMGESKPIEPTAPSLGVVPIDTSKVVMPSGRTLTGWVFQEVIEDGKACWQRFEVLTTQGTEPVEPGIQGDEEFKAYCAKVEAMFKTSEGQAVIAANLEIVGAKPLELSNVTVKAAEEVSEPVEPAPDVPAPE